MEAIQYKAKSGVMQFKPVLAEGEELGDYDNMGFCLACGAEASCVEPDARKYTCESCGKPKVYGLEELLLMGLLRIR
jgi:hypothetical protein